MRKEAQLVTIRVRDIKRGLQVDDKIRVDNYFHLLFSEGEMPSAEFWDQLCDDVFKDDIQFGKGRVASVFRRFTLIEGGFGRKEEKIEPEYVDTTEDVRMKPKYQVYHIDEAEQATGIATVMQEGSFFSETIKRIKLISKTRADKHLYKSNCASGDMRQMAKEARCPMGGLPLSDAIAYVKTCAVAKFDETIEIAMNLGVDPRHADQMVRGVVNLPNGTGRTVRVAVFARGAKADEAKAAGADIVGAEDLVEIVQGGKIDFDRCIATPDMMPLVGRLGKVLGPRGMMPNPKVGTVTMDVKAAVEASKGGAVEFRVEKAGIIHAGVGKASFDAKALEENIKAFADAVIKAKPAGAKGNYLKRMAISSTMGPGVKISTDSVLSRELIQMPMDGGRRA